jgi:pimeloyl-ACP methyl ester carboxylesterase
MAEALQIRIHGEASLPTLVYLPGIHGDWTLIASFRKAVEGKVRFVEFTYPRTTEWSLAEYAAAVEAKLLDHGVTNGWLLAESFSSQVAWEVLASPPRGHRRADTDTATVTEGASAHAKSFTADGLILAGGFVTYPRAWQVRFAEWTFRHTTDRGMRRFLGLYARYARYRHRHAPETMEGVAEFIARRTEPDRLAMIHRLRLIRGNDARAIASQTDIPVFHLFGLVDPIVPGFATKRWLKKHCPGWRASRLLCPADHNILGTAPQRSAQQVLDWLNAVREQTEGISRKAGVNPTAAR